MKFHSWVGIWVGQVALKSRDRQEVQYRDKDEGLTLKWARGYQVKLSMGLVTGTMT